MDRTIEGPLPPVMAVRAYGQRNMALAQTVSASRTTLPAQLLSSHPSRADSYTRLFKVPYHRNSHARETNLLSPCLKISNGAVMKNLRDKQSGL